MHEISSPETLSWAHPLIREWFCKRFGALTEPQEKGWPHILAGETTLISAPTGSGKTLTAFLACLDNLVRQALCGRLLDRTAVLYVSPLKALGNDIQKNLDGPLAEIRALAEQKGLAMQHIRTAVRTGDTLMHERRAMLKKPPHILVTTPESLYILLTAEKSRWAFLKHIATVIVDEIHAVADDKRGSHLALSLERLEDITLKRPVRIGLSATQRPIEVVARFLCGSGRPQPVIVDVGHIRKLDVAVEVPASPLGAVATNEMWDEIYDRIAELVEQHRSTLVFVNTRRLAERVALHLAERLGGAAVGTHHGSLSRKLRLDAEQKLKMGEIKVLAATASLELGIDIGFVDLVCQIGSPRSISAALQRIGRAGHWRGAVPKGRIFATTRDELVECAALVQAINEGDLDCLIVPEEPIDILAQQIVAMCATDEWDEDALYKTIRMAFPYRDLSRNTFNAVLDMLAHGFAGKVVRFGAYLHRDLVNKKVRARRGARLTAITNGGAIPETGLFAMVAEPEGTVVGTLDEDFAVESNRGDIILLGNTSWRIKRVEASAGRVLVEDAHAAPPTVPFWRGEAPARTEELSRHVAALRKHVSDLLPKDAPLCITGDTSAAQNALTWLMTSCGLDKSGAEQLCEYVVQGRSALGAVPTDKTIIAERFFDEGGGMQLVIHAPFGGRINKAWGLALRKRFCRSFNLELQAAATDNGLNIALSDQHSFVLADVFHYLHSSSVQQVLEQATLASPIFASRWRWDATRALALLRFQNGRKVPPQIQRMRAEDLLAAVFPDAAACAENITGDLQIPDHPLVQEVMKDVLTEALDVEGLKLVLRAMEDGSIRCLAVDTPCPSQFAHEILNANPYAYLDDAPLEERRARAVEMRQVLPESLRDDVGRLDTNAIAQVQEEAWLDIRDRDEMHDALLTMVTIPEDLAALPVPPLPGEWLAYLHMLAREQRAGLAQLGAGRFWYAAEKAGAFLRLHPEAITLIAPMALPCEAPSPEEAIQSAIGGWLQHLGPVTSEALATALCLSRGTVDQALLRLQTSGSILQGRYTANLPPCETQWCDRRLLSRIHRLTVGTLRKQIEPVSAAQFMRWLLSWQHLAPGSQLSGERGLFRLLAQLQGYELPANAWEHQVLARRMTNYTRAHLDQLCLTGAVGWGRLSPHPAVFTANRLAAPDQESKATIKRVVPTSVAPIAFFLREQAEWMIPKHPDINGSHLYGLSHAGRRVFHHLKERGASFFADIVRSTNLLKAEVETALWELVTAGLVTADGFDNLRSLIDPKRRSGQGSARTARPRSNPGRWSLLFWDQQLDRQRATEAACRLLLERYGIVFRDLLARESLMPKWRELLTTLRRLEDQGEIRGGRFVSGFHGEQFALPIALESLRAMRDRLPSGEVVTISAADPLNLCGIIVPGERLHAVSSGTVSFKDGITTSCASF